MGRFSKKSTTIGTASAALVLAVSGAAYAYWTTTGSGTGSSTTSTNVALTLTQNSTVSGMVPGGTAKDIDYTIHNSASTPQYVTSVVISISGITYTAAAGAGNGTTLANHPAGMAAVGCTSSDFTITQPASVAADLPAGDTAYTWSTTPKGGRIAMINSGSNQDGCKGTTVALAYAIS